MNTDAERAAYWAQKGQKRPKRRGIAKSMCNSCKTVRGTFEYKDTPNGRTLVHVGCPGPRQEILPTTPSGRIIAPKGPL